MVETERGDVRGIQRKGYQSGFLEGRRGHKQYMGEDSNQHSKSGLRDVWSNQKKVKARLKILDGATRKSEGLLTRKKNAIDACTMTGVWTT